jgi:hypothetical protein
MLALLSADIANAAGRDAAVHSARASGRTVWNQEDADTGARVSGALFDVMYARAARGRCPLDGNRCDAGIIHPLNCVHTKYPLCK